MIFSALTWFRQFFRPYRQHAYRHAPSIEELHLRRHHAAQQASWSIVRSAGFAWRPHIGRK